MTSDDCPTASDNDNVAPDADIQHGPPRRTSGDRRIFLLAVLFESGLGVLAWLIGWLCKFPALQTLSWTATGLLWGVVGTLPLAISLLVFDRYPVGPFRDVKRVVDDLIVPLFRGLRVWQLLAVAIVAGVGEEMLFRGLLQGALATVLATWCTPAAATWLALVIASLVFGLMHPITRTYAVLCMIIGVYLGGLWIVTDNLLVPIIIHAAYDFVALVYLVRGTGNPVRRAAQ